MTAMPKIRFRLEMSCVIQNSYGSIGMRHMYLQLLCLAKLFKVHELSECRASRILRYGNQMEVFWPHTGTGQAMYV